MNAVMRPVLRYHGGKFGNRGSVADKIIATLPVHRIYVEPFGGAASVLMRKPRSYAEVYNDVWGGVVTVFKVLRDPEKAKELERRLRLTPFARQEFDDAFMRESAPADEIEFARFMVIRSFMGFGSAAANPTYTTGFRANSNKSGTTPAHDWANYPDHIDTFSKRLQGVIVENRKAVDIILQQDSPGTLHFCDPPYVHSTRSAGRKRRAEYEFEMSDSDHEALAEVLRSVEGMVALCGYHSDLYDRLYGDWERIEFAALAGGARARQEVLWFNPAATARRKLPLEGAA